MKNDIKQKRNQAFSSSDVEFERTCKSVNVKKKKKEAKDCSLGISGETPASGRAIKALLAFTFFNIS